MNKEIKTLPQAIKIVIGKYGKNVVNDVRIVNIMNDIVSLEDSNAVKTIMRDCIRLGYGGKILAITSKDNYHLKIKSFSKDISDSYGYKDVIVQYILYSIAYGVGICPQEPYLRNHETHKNEITQSTPKEDKKEEAIVKKAPYKTITAVFVVLIVVVFWGFSSWTASKEKEKFENNVFTGNSFMSSGDYDKAFESYKEAYNGYNAINSSKYKEDALEKIDEITAKLLKEGETDNKSLLKAYNVLQSEMQLNLEKNDKDRLQAKMEEIESLITEKTDNGRNSLITNISANNGRLDNAGKQLLEDLLILAPNDYWLNFIKNKNYE